MFCPKCGNEVKEGDMFCGECGTRMEPLEGAGQETEVNQQEVKPHPHIASFMSEKSFPLYGNLSQNQPAACSAGAASSKAPCCAVPDEDAELPIPARSQSSRET